MRKALFVTVACIFALAVSTGGSIGDTYAEEIDFETGEVFSEDVGEEMAEGIKPTGLGILLTFPDTVGNTVTNQQVFTARVDYFPSITGKRTEKFIFKWPSRCADFSEKTVTIKKSRGSGVTASWVIVVTPSALCVEGIFEAKVKVTKGTKTWTAKALMTVVNP